MKEAIGSTKSSIKQWNQSEKPYIWMYDIYFVLYYMHYDWVYVYIVGVLLSIVCRHF